MSQSLRACPDLCGPVTVDTAGFSGFQERPGVLVLVPAVGVGHLETVAGIAELLLLVAGRARGIRIGEADAVSAAQSVPTWLGGLGTTESG